MSRGKKSGHSIIPRLVGGSLGLLVTQGISIFLSSILTISKSIGHTSTHGHKMAATTLHILSIQNNIPNRKEERQQHKWPSTQLALSSQRGNLFLRVS